MEALVEIESLWSQGAYILVLGAVARYLTPFVKATSLWDKLPPNWKWVAPTVIAVLAAIIEASVATESWFVFGVHVFVGGLVGSLTAIGLYHGPTGNTTKHAEPTNAKPMQGLKTSALHGLILMAPVMLVSCSVQEACSPRAERLTAALCVATAAALAEECSRSNCEYSTDENGIPVEIVGGDCKACTGIREVMDGCTALFHAQEGLCSEG